jgi:hypothetical protein
MSGKVTCPQAVLGLENLIVLEIKTNKQTRHEEQAKNYWGCQLAACLCTVALWWMWLEQARKQEVGLRRRIALLCQGPDKGNTSCAHAGLEDDIPMFRKLFKGVTLRDIRDMRDPSSHETADQIYSQKHSIMTVCYPRSRVPIDLLLHHSTTPPPSSGSALFLPTHIVRGPTPAFAMQ